MNDKFVFSGFIIEKNRIQLPTYSPKNKNEIKNFLSHFLEYEKGVVYLSYKEEGVEYDLVLYHDGECLMPEFRIETDDDIDVKNIVNNSNKGNLVYILGEPFDQSLTTKDKHIIENLFIEFFESKNINDMY